MYFGDSIVIGRRQRRGVRLPDDGAPFLWRHEFSIAQAAPLPDPFNGEKGIFHPRQIDGQLSTSGGNLVLPGSATPADGDSGWYMEQQATGGFARQSGIVHIAKLNLTNASGTTFCSVGLSLSADPRAAAQDIMAYLTGGSISVGRTNTGNPGLILPVANNTDYIIYLWVLTTGYLVFIQGGVYTNPTLVFPADGGNAATLWPSLANYNGIGTEDYTRGRLLPAAYQTDYANITGLVRVTSGNQSIGAELLTNGNMETGDPPSSWTNAGGSTASSVADERTGGSGSKSMQQVLTAAAGSRTQNIAVNAGDFVQLTGWVKNVDAATGAGIFYNAAGAALFPTNYVAATSWTQYRKIFRQASTAAIYLYVSGVAGQAGKHDDVSAKKVTLNTAIAHTTAAYVRLRYPVAASPIPGERIILFVRLNAVGEEFYNCFALECVRNEANTLWDVAYCKYVTGTRSVLINATGLGNIDGLCVVVEGNNHRAFRRLNSTTLWSQTGGTIVDSAFNTATLGNAMWTDGFSGITELIALPFNTGWEFLAGLGS